MNTPSTPRRPSAFSRYFVVLLVGLMIGAVATVMLLMSFVLLLVINALQVWQRKRSGG